MLPYGLPNSVLLVSDLWSPPNPVNTSVRLMVFPQPGVVVSDLWYSANPA